ncbi:polysaccharide deacetylase family protein [Kitasatospora sp. NPDC096147]|uniref:polysaccharide deacetylase family protein n=1 Tax=Kitasatospora sp. NPDC096147 TaxID=3364093 RepID=UPI0038245207
MSIGSSRITRSRLLAGLCLAVTAAGCGSLPSEPGRDTAPPPAAAAAVANPAAAVLPGRASEQEYHPVAEPRVRAAPLTGSELTELARAWGLDAPPLPAPAPPAVKPELRENGPHVQLSGDGLPARVRRVPTTDKVVFLTVDDGLEKDRRFNRMMRELGVPFSAFVSGYLARSDYGYFRELNDQGVRVNNHTLDHKDLRRLDRQQQSRQICGQQDELVREVGPRPVLFRPPYGEFNADTLRAAKDCGITAMPLWNEEAFPDRMEYRHLDQRLHPGDIILTHFRGAGQWGGSMTDLARLVIRTATEQGFALARLDDYLG